MVDPRMLAVLFGVVGLVRATPPTDFRFSNTHGDGMVLQVPGMIWGWGTPDQTVVINISAPSIAGEPLLQTKVSSDGVWRQLVPAHTEYSGLTEFTITAVSGGQTTALTSVLFGRVVLCSGQSNIATVTVPKALNGTAEVAAAPSFTHVRLFKVAQDANESKLDDFAVAPETPWGAPTLTNIVSFSATCFFVARDLYTDLGGEVAVGVVQSASGGTAVRNWAPIEALAKCPQPYNSPDRYGTHPYEHAVLYNAMIHPLTTGPTSISFVIWDQAESDSFPQTPLGYYGCQTTFHVDSWRRAFGQPTLPWLFVHLQPYTGSGPCCLPDLRAMQLQALALPAVGFASAVDLGDPSSPLGNVHFQNKQVVSQRLVAVALQLAFDRPRTTDGYGAWPPPAFLTQSVQSTESKFEVAVTLAAEAPFSLMFGATVDILNQTSAICPATVDPGNCSGFEVLTSDGVWHPATAKISGASVLLSATVLDTVGSRKLAVSALSVATTPYAVGSRYAWNAWPLATLFAANKDGSLGLPILPWQQALTMAAPSA